MSDSDSECKLSMEQKKFLEECLLEFANRFTNEDEEYKKAYERGISTPPMIRPWYGRPRLTAARSGHRHSHSSYGDRQHDRDRYDSCEPRHKRHRNDYTGFRPY